jgi:hypothetical protein
LNGFIGRVRAARSVAADAAANDDEKIPVLVAQASGKEETFSSFFLLAMAPFSDPPGNSFPQAAAPTSIVVVVVAVTPIAEPLAQAAPQLRPVAKKIGNEVPHVLARLYPVPQKVG